MRTCSQMVEREQSRRAITERQLKADECLQKSPLLIALQMYVFSIYRARKEREILGYFQKIFLPLLIVSKLRKYLNKLNKLNIDF